MNLTFLPVTSCSSFQPLYRKLPEFHEVKQLFFDSVSDVKERHHLYHEARHFVRETRKLSFENIVELIFFMTSSSSNTQLADYFDFNPDLIPCASSLTEARKKLDYRFFEDVFKTFMKKIGKFVEKAGVDEHGLRFLAYDGSSIPLETFDKSDDDCVDTRSDSRQRAAIFLHGLYDVVTGIFVDFKLERVGKRNETRAAKELVSRFEDNSQVCFIGDRNYHCFELEYRIASKGLYYIHRMKEVTFYKLLGLPKADDENEEFDESIKKVLVPNSKGLALKKRIHPNTDFYGVNPKTFDFSGIENGQYLYEARLLKIKINEGQYEFIVTNLPENKYPLKAVRDLYCKRWLVERGYENIKYGIGLQAIHARRMDLIKQEVYAGMTLHNLAAFLILIANEKLKEKQKQKADESRKAGKEPKVLKHDYKINRTFVFQTCRDFLLDPCLSGDDYLKIVLRHRTPVKPGRRFPRSVVKKKATSQHRLR